MERLKALEASKNATPINISDYYDESEEMQLLDDDLFSDELVGSNHPINAQSEGDRVISVQA